MEQRWRGGAGTHTRRRGVLVDGPVRGGGPEQVEVAPDLDGVGDAAEPTDQLGGHRLEPAVHARVEH